MARSLDPRTPVFVSFDQPWGEYLTGGKSGLSPLHFAEMLIRTDLGLAGIGLEMNMGYRADGIYARDVLEINELLDVWSLLGLPLIVMLAIPSSSSVDPRAISAPAKPMPGFIEDPEMPESQKAFADRLIPLLLAKQSVYGVAWNQVFDSLPHHFANAGLFTADDAPKPALGSLLALRRAHLE
jgi:hypothetical protein